MVYTYDALNRPSSETSAGVRVGYAYDLAGNRTRVQYGVPGNPAGGRLLVSTPDALDRLSRLAESAGAGANPNVTTYAYDLDGNLLVRTLPDGETQSRAFDAGNRLSATSDRSGGGAVLLRYGYGYDAGGNARAMSEYGAGLPARAVAWTYDAADRLTAEASTPQGGATSTTTYAYDAANNRTGVTNAAGAKTVFAYNNLNELTGYGNVSLGYDANGNRRTRTAGGSLTDTYAYDGENRLVGDTHQGVPYAYAYDYRGRRVGRSEGGATTAVVFSGGTSVQEYASGAATPSLELIRGSDLGGGGVGGLLYSLRGGAASFAHYDRRGDVVARTSGAAVVTYQAQYEAFGTRPAEFGGTPERQKANTKEEDPTGLLDEGLRYRDLAAGVFLTRDPLGMIDGPNLYSYVNQNPWTKFDPEGLYSWTEFGHDADSLAGGTLQGLGEANMITSDVNRVSHNNFYQGGLAVGHVLGLAQGIIEHNAGEGMIEGGATMVVAGGAATVGTGGVASPVSVPTMVGGGALAVVGTTIVIHGSVVAGKSGILLLKDAGDSFGAGGSTGADGPEPSARRMKENSEAGAKREQTTDQQLKEENPTKEVQRERALRDADGKKVIDPVTGEGRRVDHAVIDRETGSARTYETTGPNVDKVNQLDKEKRIRDLGGTYIRDKGTRKMVPVEGVSELRRVP